MAKNIKVTPEVLVSTAGVIDNLADDYKKLYEMFYKETSDMASAWQGKDNLAFIDQIAGFKDDFEKMKNLMDRYVEFLKDSAAKYRDTQDAVVAAAKKLTN